MAKSVNLILFVIFVCQKNCAEIIQAQPDEACELKANSSVLFLSVNRTWASASDPCTVYKCKTVGGANVINIQRLTCNTSCTDDFIYKSLPSECCGKCFSRFCLVDEKKYKAGDIWKSAGNCTVNECINDGHELVVSSYKKSCPSIKNCPQANIEIRDCCPFCNYRTQRNLVELNEVELTNRDIYRAHPCLRECVKGQQLTCYYEFIIEEFHTMSKACYNCPTNETDCFRPHCISADGMKRSITVVNRSLPGPRIEVCLNDTIIVDVKNRLMSEGTTIHWHGIHQKRSPFMDGVPHISQCAIPPGQNFRYNFNAQNAGTHFWHSHLGLQRGDGAFGAMIVRNPSEPHENLYDYDMSEHTLITNDWTHSPESAVFTAHYHAGGENKPSNILINGRGKYFGNMTKTKEKLSHEFKIEVADVDVFTTTELIETSVEPFSTFPYFNLRDDDEINQFTTTEKVQIIRNSKRRRITRALLEPNEDSPIVPYEVFNVVKGFRYRFRHVNAGFLNCPIELSVDNHTITAIASDGNSLEPTEATFLVTYAGERWDFIINANQEIGNYFIRARGLMDCGETFTASFQMAVLHYNSARDENPPGIKPSYQLSRKGLSLNDLNKPHGQNETRTVAEMKSAENRVNNIMKPEPDFKFFLSYDFYKKDNPRYHDPNLYGFNEVTFGPNSTPQINHITMKMPSTPAMLAKGQIEASFCNETSLAAQGVNCKETFCECTHTLQVPLKSVVEIILVDEGVAFDANHMFHLHGHFFHVVGMDRIARNVTIEEIKEMDKLGRLRRQFKDSPQKDTVTVPDGGYTIIRFYADNPGMWLLHCHIDFHAEIGMALIMKVGEFHEMAPVPRGFPTCYDYHAESSVLDNVKAASLHQATANFYLIFSSLLLIIYSKLG